jgi:hypothetical protein
MECAMTWQGSFGFWENGEFFITGDTGCWTLYRGDYELCGDFRTAAEAKKEASRIRRQEKS